MKMNQKGAIDLWVIALLVAVIGIGGVAYWRISSSDDSSLSSIETKDYEDEAEALPEDLNGIKSIDEIETIVGVTDDVVVVGFVLEAKDSGSAYKITLSNGKQYTVDAASGSILAEEDIDIDESKFNGGVATLSPSEAYAIASAQSDSPIDKIELEVEDGKITYKIEFKDGSKVEVDASTGDIVKQEIKSESRSDEYEDEEEDEHEDDEYEEEEDEHEDDEA